MKISTLMRQHKIDYKKADVEYNKFTRTQSLVLQYLCHSSSMNLSIRYYTKDILKQINLRVHLVAEF